MFDFLNSWFKSWFSTQSITNTNYHGKVVTIHTLHSNGSKSVDGKLPFSHLSEIAKDSRGYSLDTTIIIVVFLLVVVYLLYKKFKNYKYAPATQRDIPLNSVSTSNNTIENKRLYPQIYPHKFIQ